MFLHKILCHPHPRLTFHQIISVKKCNMSYRSEFIQIRLYFLIGNIKGKCIIR